MVLDGLVETPRVDAAEFVPRPRVLVFFHLIVPGPLDVAPAHDRIHFSSSRVAVPDIDQLVFGQEGDHSDAAGIAVPAMDPVDNPIDVHVAESVADAEQARRLLYPASERAVVGGIWLDRQNLGGLVKSGEERAEHVLV